MHANAHGAISFLNLEIVRTTGTTRHANICSVILADRWCSACFFPSLKASRLGNRSSESYGLEQVSEDCNVETLRSEDHSWQSQTASLEHAMQRYSALGFGMPEGHSKSKRMHAGCCAIITTRRRTGLATVRKKRREIHHAILSLVDISFSGIQYHSSVPHAYPTTPRPLPRAAESQAQGIV